MHYQHRNPFRERDHRISLMPLQKLTTDARAAGEPSLLAGTLYTLAGLGVVAGVVGFLSVWSSM